ncbi:MAG: DUF885 family protein [Devosia sp.]
MSVPYDPSVVDAFLEHHWTYRPVDATFMGDLAHDMLLPPATSQTLKTELASLAALEKRVGAMEEPDDVGDRLDYKTIRAELVHQRMAAEKRARVHNPAWYSGEAAFSIISLLLPQSLPVRDDALLARLNGIADFLSAGLDRLGSRPTPSGWVSRAKREATAMGGFLRTDLRLHEAYVEDWDDPAEAAAAALDAFAAAIDALPDADPAAGEDYLQILIRDVHGLTSTPADLIEVAQAAYDRMGRELEEMAKVLDPERSWQDQLADLPAIHPETVDDAFESYLEWDVRALVGAQDLMSPTPAQSYDLDYRWMSPCFARISQSLYFLFYRSPPALNPGAGSVYWVSPPGDDDEAFLRANSTATVKTIHSVHHGSVGHHSQNARARIASSRLARLAGTDCALGLAFLGSGTLIEGWACYVEDLLMEVRGFYTPTEIMLLKQYERRNAASVLVDVKLHTGQWSMDEAMAFYREAGFAPSRVEGEVVRNSMLPGSRLMYFLGVEGINAMRKRWKGAAADFHDTLLSYGHVPLAWIGQEMEREGLLDS